MNTTSIQYPGYTIEIPDPLLKPFRVLSTVLSGVDHLHPMQMLENPAIAEIIEDCNFSVLAAIGKEYAHDAKIGDAVNQWNYIGYFDRAMIIRRAAARTEPLDLGLMLETGRRFDEI